MNEDSKLTRFLKLGLFCMTITGCIVMVGGTFFSWPLWICLLLIPTSVVAGPLIIAGIAGLILGIGIMTGKIL